MRALVKYAAGKGNVELRDVPEPVLQDGTVLVDMAAVGVCGTDRMAIEGTHDFNTPRILGHEVSGVVAELGPGVGVEAAVLGERGFGALAELVGVPSGLGYADDRDVKRAALDHGLEGGEDFFVGEIACGAEEDECV